MIDPEDVFLKELATLLFDRGDAGWSIDIQTFEVTKTKDYYQIEYGLMYEAPVLNLTHLFKLSEIFGTQKIDVDHYSKGGCETCDYGSDYGHTIQIYDATKNVEELDKLIGRSYGEGYSNKYKDLEDLIES